MARIQPVRAASRRAREEAAVREVLRALPFGTIGDEAFRSAVNTDRPKQRGRGAGDDETVMERVNGRAVFPSQRPVLMTSGGMSGLAGGMSAGQKAGLGAAGAVLAGALTLGLMKLLSKKKSDNGDAAREDRRRERRSKNSAFKKGGVVKKRNGKHAKAKMVKKAVHKAAGKR